MKNISLKNQIHNFVPISVCLILKDRGWILEKMALRLVENLSEWNIKAEIASHPSPNVDVNHWMLYYDFEGKLLAKNTIAITHVDRFSKIHILRQRLKKVEMGICMSRMTMEQLVAWGISREKLTFINPAHDGLIKPKRIVIGITSQIRKDGAKRENILIEMAKKIHLNAFHFEIIGPNWERVIPYFEKAGATVNYHKGVFHKDNKEHFNIIHQKIHLFDYYLYMGWDEGSMGILDALAAGIPTIVTPQGFHLDINNGITHSFLDENDLCNILMKLSTDRQQRIDSVADLTWSEYSRKHALVWNGIYNNKKENINFLVNGTKVFSNELPFKKSIDWKKNWMIMRTRFNLSSFIEDAYLLWGYYTGRKLFDSGIYRFAKYVKNKIISLKLLFTPII